MNFPYGVDVPKISASNSLKFPLPNQFWGLILARLFIFLVMRIYVIFSSDPLYLSRISFERMPSVSQKNTRFVFTFPANAIQFPFFWYDGP